MNKKSLKSFIIAHWILIWLIIIVILLISTVSFGAYIYLKYAKRVVSTVSDNGIAFSSNLLSPVPYDYKTDDYSSSLFTYSDGTNIKMITVCNYPQNDPTDINKSDISYVFTMKLITHSGELIVADAEPDKEGDKTFSDELGVKHKFRNFTLKFNNSDAVPLDGSEMRIQSILTGMTASSDRFTITYEGDDVSKINIEFTATPSEESIDTTDNTKLSKVFNFTNITRTKSWKGEFADEFALSSTTDKGKLDTRNYDGFNYEIKGSGTGVVSLKWKPEFIALGCNFTSSLEEEQIVESREDEIRFRVGGEYTATSYRIQFYRVRPCPKDEKYDSTFNTVVSGDNKYVVFEYDSDE